MCEGVGQELCAYFVEPDLNVVVPDQLARPLMQPLILELAVVAPRVRHESIDAAEHGRHRQVVQARVWLVVGQGRKRERA